MLPGLAFKAVVIGGGYATGRELVEFFLPSGPWGGLAAILLATLLWCGVCVTTFLFARVTGALDYRTFFRELLGPLWPAFEITYALLVLLVMSVFGASAGAIGASLFGWPLLTGTVCLMATIVLFASLGNAAVEGLFKWVSFFLYATYVVFLVLGLTHFGHRIADAFTAAETPSAHGWIFGGLTYAGYNVLGAVIILPALRHLTGSRDAIVAGLLAGPLAMLPALLFFICMCAFESPIRTETLPSDFLLKQMNLPLFHFAFQLMIFLALVESGTGSIHAVNQRVSAAFHARYGHELPTFARLSIASAVLVCAIFIAGHFGLVALIAKGYTALAYAVLVVYVAPLFTFGIWRIRSISKPRA